MIQTKKSIKIPEALKDDFKVLGQSNSMYYVENCVPSNELEPARHTKGGQKSGSRPSEVKGNYGFPVPR